VAQVTEQPADILGMLLKSYSHQAFEGASERTWKVYWSVGGEIGQVDQNYEGTFLQFGWPTWAKKQFKDLSG